MKMEQSVTPELRVALELEAHEKECSIRYAIRRRQTEWLGQASLAS
jgi:hypothetical protein